MAGIVVIGAGMGGMAAAARLAHAGHDVHVVEQAPTHGGKLGTYQRDGFTFDTGPSLLTLPEVYRDLFRETGGDLDALVTIEPVDPTCHYRFADGTELSLPHAESAVPAAIDAAFGPAAGRQWAAAMRHAARAWALVGEPVLRNPFRARDVLRWSANLGDLRTIAPWRTLRQAGRRWFDDPRLVMLLDRYATYSGSDPRRIPAVMAVVAYLEQHHGGWYVRGGLRTLADALHRHCTDLGVRFTFDTAVTEVRPATGVRLADGRVEPADVVVSDVDAAHLYGDLVPHKRAQRALRRVPPSLAGFVVLLALRGRSEPRHHHRVLFPRDYDAEFDAVFGRAARPVSDPAIYVCAPDDPAVHPEAGEAWFVLVNAPRQGHGRGAIDWTAPGLADRYADHLLDLLAERGLDVRDRVLWREVRTPADWARDTGAVGGAIYGSSSNGPRAALVRPRNRSPVPGLYLVGGSAHPGGGLPLVALSAEIVARQIGRA